MLRWVTLIGILCGAALLAFQGANAERSGTASRAERAEPPASDDDRPVLLVDGTAPRSRPERTRAGEAEAASPTEERVEVVPQAPAATQPTESLEALERSARSAWEGRARWTAPTTPAWPRPRPAAEDGRRRAVVPKTDAVLLALRWLAAHQALDGRFPAADFGRWCEGRDDSTAGPDGAGSAQHDVGATALATLAFLGAGYTHRGDHEFHEVVRRALLWLRSCQDDEGYVALGRHAAWAWDHACAAFALVEAYGMTESPFWKVAAQRAVTATERLREPNGPWRYGRLSDPSDASLTFWAALPLHCARMINEDARRRGRPLPLIADPQALDAAHRWAREGTAEEVPEAAGRGPDLPGATPHSLFACATLLRILAGEDAKTSPDLARCVQSVVEARPRADAPSDSVDMVQRWVGTLVTFQVGREPWKAWDEAMQIVVGVQHLPPNPAEPPGDLEGEAEKSPGRLAPCGVAGSWDPVGAWAERGGRVVVTALTCMSLEVYYRYSRSAFAK